MLFCFDARDLLGLLREGDIKLHWHPALSEQMREEVLSVLEACDDGRLSLDILCVFFSYGSYPLEG